MVRVCAREKNAGWGCGLKPVTQCVYLTVKKKSLCVIKDCMSVRACMVQMGLLHFSSSASLFFSFRTLLAQDKCVFVCIEALVYI